MLSVVGKLVKIIVHFTQRRCNRRISRVFTGVCRYKPNGSATAWQTNASHSEALPAPWGSTQRQSPSCSEGGAK